MYTKDVDNVKLTYEKLYYRSILEELGGNFINASFSYLSRNQFTKKTL